MTQLYLQAHVTVTNLAENLLQCNGNNANIIHIASSNVRLSRTFVASNNE